METSPVVVGGLVHSVYDLKAAQMNMQHCPIQKFMLNESELNHSTMEASKNILRAKEEGAVDHSAVTRWLKKFCLGRKNIDDHARSSGPKTMDSKDILQAIEANVVSTIERVRGKLNISQSSMFHHLHNLGTKHPEQPK